MDTTYELTEKKSRDVLSQVAKFKEKMDMFCEKHPEYKYTVSAVDKTEEGFTVKINVRKDEK